uniref:Polycomb group RING finger protein 3 n=1 Tax=Cacopsylla melanoneura TaxID=428564 RepID=A0A8D8YQX6_9HEMI
MLDKGDKKKIKVKTLNSILTCKICKGYLIDATTVTECLHTFCKSCLVQHLDEKNTCPSCNIIIHQSHPLQYISFDRTMQDLVYKLVPNLQSNEMKREREFYRIRGLPCPKDLLLEDEEEENQDSANSDYHRLDEQVNIYLECSVTTSSASLKTLKKKFLRLSSQATITHLKKFVALKLLDEKSKYKEVRDSFDEVCSSQAT